MKGLALLLPVLVALQVGVQPALAWAWPVDGPVLRLFVLGDDPYLGGQHRGIDIGAPEGAPVRAPAGGTVSFAGTVPTGGKTITIRTSDGYAVTLLHLGAYPVARGADIGEGDVVGLVGASGAAAEAPRSSDGGPARVRGGRSRHLAATLRTGAFGAPIAHAASAGAGFTPRRAPPVVGTSSSRAWLPGAAASAFALGAIAALARRRRELGAAGAADA